MPDDTKVIGAIGVAAAAAEVLGSVTIATYTTAAPGILGAIGLTTTATVAAPAAGIVAVGGLLYFGAMKVKKYL